MSNNNLATFTEKVNCLIQSELILVDKNIASLLKCVASVPQLCKCLEDTLKSTSYVTEFSRAIVTWTGNDGKTQCSIKVPADTNRIFAFVTCLLLEIDSGRRNFTEFLREYYYCEDTNESYQRFAEEVLKPFKRAGESLLQVEQHDVIDSNARKQAERYFIAESIYIAPEVTNLLLQMSNSVYRTCESVITSAVARNDAMTVLTAFCNALLVQNPKLIRLCWVAFKYTFNYKVCEDQVNSMYSIIKQANLE